MPTTWKRTGNLHPHPHESTVLPSLVRALNGRTEAPYRELTFLLGEVLPPGRAQRLAAEERRRHREDYRRLIGYEPDPKKANRKPSADPVLVGRNRFGRSRLFMLYRFGYVGWVGEGRERIVRVTDKYREEVRRRGLSEGH